MGGKFIRTIGQARATRPAGYEQLAVRDGLKTAVFRGSLKKLSKNLDLDDTGGSRRIKNNILAWLKQDHD